MGNRALKEEIERLEGELMEASRHINTLKIAKNAYWEELMQLRAELSETKEKYTALLEKYIAMMEERVK